MVNLDEIAVELVLTNCIQIGSILLTLYLNHSRDILPDFMTFERLHKQLLQIVNIIVFALFLTGCTTIAPVQEMSNARQSIQAAKDANAENLAANVLSEAQKRLRSAMRELDAGEYERARILALEAKHLALKAKQLAASSKVN